MTRSLLYVAALCMVCLAAVWSYRVIERTGDLRAEVAQLRAQIAQEREAIDVLRAEWAWLNRPERLARLAETHAGALGLEPMAPGHFARISAVAFQPPPPHPPGPAPAPAALPAAEARAALRLMGRAETEGGAETEPPPADGTAPPPAEGVRAEAAGPAPAPAPAADAAPEQTPRPAVAGPARGPVPPGLRRPPAAPDLGAAETPVTLAAIAGNDWLALGLPLPPERPARP